MQTVLHRLYKPRGWLLRELERRHDVVVASQVPMARVTTFRIGGPAATMLIPRTLAGLEKCLERLEATGRRYFVLGRGSNLLVSDSGVETVLSLREFSAVESQPYPSDANSVIVTAGAGCGLRQLVAWCARRGLGGIEGLAGIPASVGGALFMNAGASGVSFGDLVQEVLLTSSQGSSWVGRDGLRFGYRKTGLPEECIISAVRLRLYVVSPSATKKNIVSVIRRRAASQPIGLASAGCVFKNFDDEPAGLVIDRCGLKGLRQGGAIVSPVHANFIVNTGGASSRDVLGLIERVRRRVFEETGRMLCQEVRVWH